MSREPDLLLPREVAELLRLKVNSVYEAAADGRLPHVLLWRGRRKSLVRFRRADIDALVAGKVPVSDLSRTGVGTGGVGRRPK